MSTYRLVYLADASSIHASRWASAFAQRGHVVHIISFLPGKVPGTTVHVLGNGLVRQEGGNWHYLLHLPALRRKIRMVRPDLLHAHYLTSYGLLGALTRVRPLVLTAWGSDVLMTPNGSRLYRLLLRFTLSRADLVTSDADTMSRRLIGYGLQPERLLTIPFGVDMRCFNPEGRHWPEKGTRLISTRNLLQNTNLQTVLAALAWAQERISHLHLDVVGDGPERQRLEALVHHLGLHHQVTWRGAVEHGCLPSLLREADLYLAATLSDGTSVSLLEAMACGAFPIASDLPANREWIEPGKNGLLVPPDRPQDIADAITQAVQSPELRRGAAHHNAALIAARANWDRNMDEIEAAYETLIEVWNSL